MYYEHDHTAKHQEDPCEFMVWRMPGQREIELGVDPYARVWFKCGLGWTSVVHRPDQYRHWCNACEVGGDHD